MDDTKERIIYDFYNPGYGNMNNNQSHQNDGHISDKITPHGHANVATSFDSMLEVLPDSMNIDFFPNYNNGSPNLTNLTNVPNNDQDFERITNENNELLQQIQIKNELEGFLTDHITENINTTSNITQPIDIANQQNGEIANMWDFNLDEFMMTPGDSTSATISAPNSLASDLHSQFGSAPSSFYITHGFNNNNNNNNNNSNSNSNSNNVTDTPSNNNKIMSNNNFNTNGMSVLLSGENNIDFDGTSPSMSSFMHNQQITLKGDDKITPLRPPMNGRISSIHMNKTLYSENGGIPLSSLSTSNSVRKNSMIRQVSSSSLTNYKRCTNSSTAELPKTAPVQCCNCKTFKTPLWRRDPQGNTLCNACGLFQKLHGTMRPLSLKSDVIKRRNAKKRTKKNQDTNTGIKDSSNTQNVMDFVSKSRPDKMKKTTLKETLVDSDTQSSNQNNNILQNLQFNMHMDGKAPYLDTNLFQNQPQNIKEPVSSNASTRTLTKPLSLTRKSRTSSICSSTSTSSRSSAKSVVPILPKPSPNSQAQFNPSIYSSHSANSSAASSPRVISSNYNQASPISTSQSGIFSNSLGRSGMTIPRRKPSRNSSSSTVLGQALQQQYTNQSTNTVGSNGNSMTPSSWGIQSGSQIMVGTSPKALQYQNSHFEPFGSSGQSPVLRKTSSERSHTSLLSQQLQNSTQNSEKEISNSTNELHASTNYQQINNMMSNSNPSSWKYSSMAASPRNSYTDSIQQQRGVRKEESYLGTRKPSSLSLKNPDIYKAQPSFTNSMGSGAITSVTGTNASATALNSMKSDNNIAEDLEWLKFGL